MLFSYTVTTLWHERQRFLSGVLAVAFSAALINLQCGLLWGLFATTSAPIDQADADIWVGAPKVPSVDLGRPINENHLARLASLPGVSPPEVHLVDYGYWAKPDGSKELCIIIGSRLTPGALGAVHALTPELRARLSEFGAIVIDESECDRLGVQGVGDRAEVNGNRVHIVGMVRGLKSLTGPYIFCSLETARSLLPLMLSENITYILARCSDAATARGVVTKLRAYPDLSAFTREEFSLRTRMHWLMRTNAGISAAFTAALGLLVGSVVTSQTLYMAMLASIREFAVLRALGIPSWRIAASVVAQSLGVGVAGVIVAQPVVFVLAWLADALGTHMLLPWWLLAGTAVITMFMALGSGLVALRSMRLIEPAALLR